MKTVKINRNRRIRNNNNNKTRSNYNNKQSFEREIVLRFLGTLNTVKLYHWKTHSFAEHKATDELYTKLNATIDSFVEVLLGKTQNRVDLTRVKMLPVKDFTSLEQMKREMSDFKSYLVGLNSNKTMKSMSNTDLYNIRDEILGDINQFLYLSTFNK